jgi:hypothetical protein
MEKKNMRRNKKVYWIDINDVQEVALQDLDRELNEEEMKKVINRMGDYINWADGISLAFDDLQLKGVEKDV